MGSKENVKLCKNCKFFKKTRLFSYKESRCTHLRADNTYINKISGKTEGSFSSCSDMRSRASYCDIEGKLYEPKDKIEAVVAKLDGGLS